MALPGMRGYGRDDNWAGGRNSGYRTRTSNQDYGPQSRNQDFNRTKGDLGTVLPDPSAGRRLDSMDQRMGKYESASRSLMEQMMKMQQDLKIELKKHEQVMNEEKNQRMRMENALQGAAMKLGDLDERVRRVEDSSKENKNALTQLIMHTKNIERAVSLSQQDSSDKMGQVNVKLQELTSKMNQANQNRETLERTCYNLRDEVRNVDGKLESMQVEVEDFKGAVKLQSAMMEKLQAKRPDNQNADGQEGRMTETQRAMLEAKLMQCQQSILDVAAKVSQEKRERDQDFDQINSRLTEVVAQFSDKDRKREAERAEQEAKAREQASMGHAEKQNIIMQISAVQTEIKRTLDERDTQLRSMTVNRLEEMDEKLNEGARQRSQMERDLKELVDAEIQKERMAAEGSVDTVRKMMEDENEKTRARIQEVNDNINGIQEDLLTVKSSLLDEIGRVESDCDSREKVLDAKIEDLSDKLRFGMATMQAAIGESRGGEGMGEGIPMEEVERLQEDAMESVRESMAKQISELEEQIKIVKGEIRKQNESIDGSLRNQRQAGEEASTILGDKLHQKMDSISFTQERMKRQVEDLQQKMSGAPSDIGDLRERIEDIERELTKKTYSEKPVRRGSVGGGSGGSVGGAPSGANSEDLNNMRREIDQMLGRDTSGRGEVDGIPNLSKMQRDVDKLEADVKNVGQDVERMREEMEEKFKEEKETRNDEAEAIRKDVERLEKKTKEIRERVKGKLGISIPDHLLDDDEDNE